MKLELLQRLNAARAAKERCCLVRNLSTHESSLVVGEPPPGELPPEIAQAVAEAYRQDRSITVQAGESGIFVQVFNPPLRLVIVGAVHIAQALAPIATLAGYEVTVVDPRGAFATEARFPDVALDGEWPDDALAAMRLDRRSAVVALTHDPKLDDPALDQALRSPAFYIAALGSRKNHAARGERLKELGHDEAAFARIHGPAGLSIGAVSPAEIAVAIMAQMTATLRGVAPASASAG